MIGKPRGKNAKRPVYVYDPAKPSGKRYVGSSADMAECRLLEAEGQVKVLKDARDKPVTRAKGWTVDAFAEHFLTAYHGPGTNRPEPTTRRHNEQCIKQFRADHGSRLLSAIDRETATALAVAHPYQAQAVAAMFAEAFDKGHIPVNPFARLGIRPGRGRADIDPLTETEVAALITFAGWTGLRPGELCALDWVNVDLRNSEVRVDRLIGNRRNDGTLGPPKHKKGRRVVLAQPAVDALRTLPRRPGAVFRTPTEKPIRPNNFRYWWMPVRSAFLHDLPADHWLPRRLMADPKDHLDVYELRHFAGSLMADRGLSSHDIALQMGNTPAVAERTYLHPHHDRVRDRVRAALHGNVTPLRKLDGLEEQAG